MSGPGPILITPRLRLRPLADGDVAAVARILSEPAVAAGLGHAPSRITPALARDWIRRRRRRAQAGLTLTLAMTRPPADDLIGTVSLRLTRAHRRGELGYWLGDGHGGAGLGREAVAALVDWLFTHLPIERVFARHLHGNPRSRRLLDALGFQLEGRLRQHHRQGGRLHDVEVRGLLRAEWQATRGRPIAPGRAPPRTAGTPPPPSPRPPVPSSRRRRRP
ncbi:MAG: GNAT family N-acetyltransferase [Kofleriaceae bacterium]|nr:GNAT family N-acetyltransferase [Kofleriaceae bacterium]MBP6835784.1 GNAT family N-acetyltransferase [Kofleriaceae bacterium]MBP9206150.1 GNAT family N-acetyltransferase [Kofleriaceae bacterium]